MLGEGSGKSSLRRSGSEWYDAEGIAFWTEDSAYAEAKKPRGLGCSERITDWVVVRIKGQRLGGL